MKKFLIIILVLIGFKAMSQPYLIQPSRWEFIKGQRFDSAFRIYNLPILTGDTVIAFNPYSKKVGLKIIAAASTPTLQQVTTAGNTSSNAIYIGSGSLDASAAFQVESTTKGILPPVMTTAQKNAISSPANGLVAYDATLQDYYVYKSGIGSGWKHIGINAYTQGDMIAPFSFGAATQAISVDTATMFDYAWSTTGNDDSGPTNKYIGTKGAVDFPIRTNNIERILVSSSGSTTFKGNLLFTDNTYDIGASGASRPRTGYFGTSVISPLVNISGQTASTIASFDGSKNVVSLSTSTYPSLTELSYVKGVTSGIQTQIDALTTAHTLLGISTTSITAPNSVYQMSAGIPVNFKSSDANNILHINETDENIAIGGTPFSSTFKLTVVGDQRISGALNVTGQVYNSSSGILNLYSSAYVNNNGNFTIGSTSSISRLAVPIAPTASANYGLVSLGNGAWDGSTSGFFTGSSSGTTLAINNVSGYAGDLINAQVAGVSKFKVDNTGLVITGASVRATGEFLINSGGFFSFATRGGINAPADGVFRLINEAQNDFGRLQFGGTTSSFPALKRSTTTLQVRLADDSNYGAIQSLYDRFGSGSPEGVVTAPIGAVYHRTDGGAGTSFYVKESGTGNTGWVAK